ncbi:DUF2169 family type VI secretion system accessory protein [Agrobacterium tumefaciens]|uniref:DUF2169 family type VI secretion system accessory protein n=1 Tax=Agrobacterium tumefaciens TaxID=358 RepID=UPI0015733D3C|nr:DUF2169 domain-containing protein [Agrobacterium tumefaciens]WCJ64627.1 DUF2169 domain-containing protein [Agrobacterium tumefaciens]
MSVDNRTPFPALAFRQFNMVGDLMGVVVARGTFKLTNGGPLQLADKQLPLVMSDVYDGDPHQTPQMACTDLAPFKPGTDVTFLGATFAPNGVPSSSWTCGFQVGSMGKRLRVHGPRVWRAKTRKTWRGLIDREHEDAMDGWELTEGQPVPYVPLDWRLAFGGRLENETVETNPVGIGLVDEARFKEQHEWAAPQIEEETNPILSVQDRPKPAGFAPISPFWKDRADLAGTYDDKWLENRHPLLPPDFDYAFWQAAPRDQIVDPWLNGDEPFKLHRLLPQLENLSGYLPNVALKVEIDQGDITHIAHSVVDGVHFDMRPGVGRVFLTWRTAFPWPHRRGLPLLSFINRVEEV